MRDRIIQLQGPGLPVLQALDGLRVHGTDSETQTEDGLLPSSTSRSTTRKEVRFVGVNTAVPPPGLVPPAPHSPTVAWRPPTFPPPAMLQRQGSPVTAPASPSTPPPPVHLPPRPPLYQDSRDMADYRHRLSRYAEWASARGLLNLDEPLGGLVTFFYDGLPQECRMHLLERDVIWNMEGVYGAAVEWERRQAVARLAQTTSATFAATTGFGGSRAPSGPIPQPRPPRTDTPAPPGSVRPKQGRKLTRQDAGRSRDLLAPPLSPSFSRRVSFCSQEGRI